MEKILRRVYMKEFKDEAVQLVVNGGLGLTEAARRLSISVKTLANWVAVAKHSTPVKAGVTRKPVTALEAENSQLKRALSEMKMERDLKKSDGVLREGIAVRYALMKTLKGQFPVSLMSRVFDVCKSGYYAWLKRGPSKRSQDNARLEVAIKAAHVRTRQSYGPERLQISTTGCSLMEMASTIDDRTHSLGS